MEDGDFLELRVIYEDPPDLVELGVRVRHGEWSAVSSAYASPSFLINSGREILRWINAPKERLRMEAGANTGIGWMVLEFYVIDRACHARCAVTLAAGKQPSDARPEQTSRLSIELPTELGLVEDFAKQCVALGSGSRRDARLVVLPT